MIDLIQTATDFVRAQAETNQFLVGGVGTVVFGGAMYLLREIPSRIWNALRRTCTSTLDLTTSNNGFHRYAECLHRNRISFFSRSYGVSPYRGELTPGFGSNWAWYRGTLVVFSKSLMDKTNEVEEQIHATFFTRDIKVIEAFVEECENDRTPGTISVSVSGGGTRGGFEELADRKMRRLDTVFVNQSIKDELIQHFDTFAASEQWYVDRGIPWKLGVLLEGEPGTGKTSIIVALASHYGLNIRYINNLSGLGSLVSELTEKDLVVIEDIDGLSLKKRNLSTKPGQTVAELRQEKTEQVKSGDLEGLGGVIENANLQHVLNTFDGMYTPHGLKFLITTNAVETLDAAVLRPGRIDLRVKLMRLDRAATLQMWCAYFPEAAEPIHEYLRDPNDFVPLTGAEMQQVFMRHRHDPVKAMSSLRDAAIARRSDLEGQTDGQSLERAAA